MTKYHFTLYIATSVLLITQGCGGSGSSAESSIEDPVSIAMEADKIYTVYPGDRLVKNTDDTVVKITHTENHPESTVQLIAGSATIIRN